MEYHIEFIKNINTPVYYYDLGLFKHTIEAAINAMSIDHRFKIHYAVKANGRPELLRIIANSGLGADCVSGNEIKAALSAGISSDKIVFAGVGKTDKDINIALSHSIGCFNVESIPELDVINTLALKSGEIAKVALRVNPEIDAHTHRYITTGTADNKFGISLSQLDEAISRAISLKGISFIGLHFHIGSQMLIYDSYKLLCERIKEIVSYYATKGIKFEIINVGGGLGIDYENPDANPIPDFYGYFKLFHEELKSLDCKEIHFELGRALVAQCGSLISRVLFVKETPTRTFAIIDAGMNDLIRPALYGAHHLIQKLKDTEIQNPGETLYKYDVVGPVCESSDCFGEDIMLPKLTRGDIIAIRSAGAYGESMASQYNMRPLIGAIFNE